MAKDFTEVKVDRIPDCDMCRILGAAQVEPAYADAKTRRGPWAFLCSRHFDSQGARLGLGLGQRLMLRTPAT